MVAVSTYIKRTDIEAGKFYIYGDLWEGFELDAKENIVRVISEHRDAEFGLPQVTLLESRSGKELASYGAFSGVTIKNEFRRASDFSVIR